MSVLIVDAVRDVREGISDVWTAWIDFLILVGALLDAGLALVEGLVVRMLR